MRRARARHSYLVLFSLSALVVLGFKARWSALILATSLGLSSVWMYPFWSASAQPRTPRRSRAVLRRRAIREAGAELRARGTHRALVSAPCVAAPCAALPACR